MKFLGIGLITCATLAGLAGLWPKEVTVKSMDPTFSVYYAHLWHWQTNVGAVNVVDHPVLRWLDDHATMAKMKRKPLMWSCPTVGWITGPNYLPQDSLVLFGYYPENVGQYFGFDLVRTNGDNCGLGSANSTFVRSSRRGLTNFGTLNLIETNLHGLFWLRLHGGTNVLATVTIR